MTETLNRRDFLFYGGATVLGVTLGEVGRRQLAKADARAAGWRQPGVETWATSVCRECPAACGVLVRLVDGVPVKLEGNPKCPVSRGRLCAKGQAAIETYFDPDRLTGLLAGSARAARTIGSLSSGQPRSTYWRVP
jgi:anaerobic selenocysteine-containing dehydrogenase